ncbi:hypothetical protein HQ590_14590 [bacterium]|nr:hypothetical protein [bacterium]
MKRRALARDWLPLAKAGRGAGELPTGEAFRAEWIDFRRGIRVGNIEPHERITQILKYHLEQRYRTPFVTDRWGRGVYWQWICWLPRANRQAKPISHKANFGCAKLFISAEKDERVFKSGLQIERGYAVGPEPYAGCRLQRDWDWHRLMKCCRAGTEFDREVERLVKREGFTVAAWGEDTGEEFTKKNHPGTGPLRKKLADLPKRHWAGFQLYYPMPESELRACSGAELVQAICGVFREVMPAMNQCLQVPLYESERAARKLGKESLP